MLLRNRAERILNFVYVKNSEPSVLPPKGLPVKNANGSLLICEIVVDGRLNGGFETALDVSHDKKLCANGDWRARNGRGSHGTRGA